MRKSAIILALFCSLSGAFAGDIANFVNLGFSADGGRFVFGQHGVNDGDFAGYADIWAVDVAKNAFLPNGKFSAPASSSTAGKDGAGVFAALQNVAAPFLAKNGIDSSRKGRALYVQAEDIPSLRDLSFRDFESGVAYEVSMTVKSSGTGASVKSSFYLTVVATAGDGTVSRMTVGLPGYERAGVKDYLVRRVITDDTGKSLVFVIEKTLYDRKGDSARYMVETARL